MAKEFRAPVSSDFEIVENGKTVCWIRIKPSGIYGRKKESIPGMASRFQNLRRLPKSGENRKRSSEISN
jgi:hypothetical protein